MMYLRLLFLLLTLFALLGFTTTTVDAAAPTITPTRSPTTRAPTLAPSGPTRGPTRKPTRNPTFRSKASSIYTDYAPTKTLTQKEQQGLVAAMIFLLFILMAFEVTTPEVLFLIALVILILTEILTLAQGLAGFSNAAVLTIGSLFLVVGAVEKSHVVDWMARKTFGATGSETMGRFRMYCTCFSLSCFFNNTPLVALLMPVTKDWGRMRNIGASQLLMPMSFAVLAGSFGSMIGTSSNLTVQGVMQADRGYSFSFFAPFPIGIVCFIALTLYQLIAAPFILPMNKSGLLRKARDSAKNLIAEVFVSPHSPAVGKNVEYFATSLGVQSSSIIKIRRAVNQFPENFNEEEDPETGKIRGSNQMRSNRSILDVKYLRKAASFWDLSSSKKHLDTNNDHQKSHTKIAEDDDEETDKKNDDLYHPENNEYTDIIAPPPHELIGANDIVFLSSAQTAVEKMMKSIMGESKGLKILKSDVLALPGFGTEVLECVISDKNPFLGKKVSQMSKEFSDTYQAAVVTVRGREWGNFFSEEEENTSEENSSNAERELNNNNLSAALSVSTHRKLATVDDEEEGGEVSLEGGKQIEMVDLGENTSNNLTPESSEKRHGNAETVGLVDGTNKPLEVPNISEHIIVVGDVVLCVTNEKNVDTLSHSRDFFVVSTVGNLPKPLTFYGLIPVACFVTMLVLVANECIDVCPASMTLAAFFFIGKHFVFFNFSFLFLFG
jgi:hypothetical protein